MKYYKIFKACRLTLTDTSLHHRVQPLGVGFNGRLVLQQSVKFLIHFEKQQKTDRLTRYLSRKKKS